MSRNAVGQYGRVAGDLDVTLRHRLGHWIRIQRGRIINYQIVAPTTWDFPPGDADGQPGAVAHALVGAPVRAGAQDPVAVQHKVCSFDPCMVCTVH